MNNKRVQYKIFWLSMQIVFSSFFFMKNIYLTDNPTSTDQVLMVDNAQKIYQTEDYPAGFVRFQGDLSSIAVGGEDKVRKRNKTL